MRAFGGRLQSTPRLVQGVVPRVVPAWGPGASEGAYAEWNVGLSTDDDRHAVRTNRREIASHLGFERLIMPHQVHGAEIVEITIDNPSTPTKCDALLVRTPGILIGVMGADCPGFMLVEHTSNSLLVGHAGWRGTAASLPSLAVKRLATCSGCPPKSLYAAIGPGISIDHYEVSGDVVEALQSTTRASLFESNLARPTKRNGHAEVDLVGIIRAQLIAAGVPQEHINVDGTCTFARDDLWFSHRRDKGFTGRHVLVAGWTK